jgi:hypothetical protein
MLYKAGQLLRALPTGSAFVSFVGEQGPCATVFTVPPVFIRPLPPDRYAALLENIFARSPVAMPVEQARQNIADRERLIMERCKPKAVPQKTKKGTWGKA